MSPLSASIDGVAVIGPGLADWTSAAPVFAGTAPYSVQPTRLPPLTVLPPAERRRAGRIVQLALATGLQATQAAQRDAKDLLAVFASSGGDGDNCHAICETLATAQRQLSPTRFHNSVHNAAAGYWGIATGSMAASSALCAYDGSFAAGLLEAVAQLAAARAPVLLVACDTPYPPPLGQKRPMFDACAVAMVLSPEPGTAAAARLSISLHGGTPQRCAGPALEALRTQMPAARAWPLLEALAQRRAQAVDLEYLDGLILRAELTPC